MLKKCRDCKSPFEAKNARTKLCDDCRETKLQPIPVCRKCYAPFDRKFKGQYFCDKCRDSSESKGRREYKSPYIATCKCGNEFNSFRGRYSKCLECRKAKKKVEHILDKLGREIPHLAWAGGPGTGKRS